MKPHLTRIAIIYGGDSSEYEVSHKSAQGLYGFFDKNKYETVLVELSAKHWQAHLTGGRTAAIDKNDFSYMEDGIKKNFDYAYITIHGTPGENGILQGYLDLIGMPYSTCGVLAEALTFNKFVLNHYIKDFGVNTAQSMMIRREELAKANTGEIISRIGLPCFVKPAADGSSFGVTKVKTPNELMPAMRKAAEQSDEIMIEEYIQGTEISIGCYRTRKGKTVLPATEVVSENEFFDFDAKYNGQVQEITPARIPEQTAARVAQMTSHIYDILHANGIIRVDYIIKEGQHEDHIYMIEVNTTPGMTVTSFIPQQVRAAGLEMAEVLDEIVQNQLDGR